MIFYKNSLFLILLLSALYLSGCEKTQNNGSILYYEQNKFEVDIKQLIDNRYYIINNSDNYNFYYRTYGDIIFYSKLKVNVITYENSILKINLKAIPVYSDDEVSSEIFVNIPNFKENVDKVIVDVNSDTAEEVYHGESRLQTKQILSMINILLDNNFKINIERNNDYMKNISKIMVTALSCFMIAIPITNQ